MRVIRAVGIVGANVWFSVGHQCNVNNNSVKAPCENGWIYEASVYKKTIVTEVSFAIIIQQHSCNSNKFYCSGI